EAGGGVKDVRRAALVGGIGFERAAPHEWRRTEEDGDAAAEVRRVVVEDATGDGRGGSVDVDCAADADLAPRFACAAREGDAFEDGGRGFARGEADGGAGAVGVDRGDGRTGVGTHSERLAEEVDGFRVDAGHQDDFIAGVGGVDGVLYGGAGAGVDDD